MDLAGWLGLCLAAQLIQALLQRSPRILLAQLLQAQCCSRISPFCAQLQNLPQADVKRLDRRPFGIRC